jgi:hypothetical protein
MAKAFASGLGTTYRTGTDGALLSILSSPAYIAWARDLLGASTRLWAYITIQLDADRHKARAAARPMIARFLGVHGEHPITRVAGMQPERARAFRSGWMSAIHGSTWSPRSIWTPTAPLATSTMSAGTSPLSPPPGWTSPYYATSAHRTPRINWRRCLRSAPTETRDQQRFDVARRMPGP